MDRESAAKYIDVIKAFINGKTVQIKDGGTWKDHACPGFVNGREYRVKPEKKYVPFETIQEVKDAMKEHGEWIRNSDTSFEIIQRITIIKNIGGDNLTINNSSAKFYFETYKFEDGTPLGKLDQ